MPTGYDIDWLLDGMKEAGEREAIAWRSRRYAYAELLVLIDDARSTLNEYGIRGGTVVSLETDYSPTAVAMLLALIERAAIVVPLSDAVRAERDAFLRIAEVQARLVAHTGWEATRLPVSVRNPLMRRLSESSTPGLVLFSSGSTGESKASLHDMAALLEKFKVRRHRLRTLVFLLLDHIGGLNTLFYTLSNTGTIVTVERRDPDVVCAAIEEYGVELLPTSPTFLNLLLISEAFKRHDLSSLKRITYGTEPMPQGTLERLHEILPRVELQQTYGLSEVGILRSKSKDSASLWVKVGGEGFETKVIDGLLWIRARSAMLGYLNYPDPFDPDGWFNTEDMVEVDGDWVRIIGRKSELINVGGEKVYPSEVESVLMEIPGVRDVTVRGERNPLTGSIVTARFHLEGLAPQDFKRVVREFCRGRLAPYKIPVKIEVADQPQYSLRFKKMRTNQS
jgi:acyl-CoA synthetase (AMP-forming)/AMP-acid ligase II